jgi:hypothetical protein
VPHTAISRATQVYSDVGADIVMESVTPILRFVECTDTIFTRKPMGKLQGLVLVVSELKSERTNLLNQLKHVDDALSALGRLSVEDSPARSKSFFSASARRKMSLAQRARRAKENGKPFSTMPRRVMPASARRKIAAAQHARWAKFRAGKKAA